MPEYKVDNLYSGTKAHVFLTGVNGVTCIQLHIGYLRRENDAILRWYPCGGSRAVWTAPEKSNRKFAYHVGFSVLNGSK